MAKVTVLLTSYNHADYIKKSIESILNQTFKDFELVIVDDCSTDNSWDIIKSYKDKRIKKIRHKKNIGGILSPELIDSFNGEYFAVAHCDDMWELDKLEKQVNFMDSHKEYAACFTWVKIIDEQDKELNSDSYVNFNVENRNRYEWLNKFFYEGNCLCHPSLLMRTKIQKDEYLYTKGLGALPDMYRWVKLLLKHDIYIYPEKLTCFRVRKGGMNTSGYNFNNNVRVSFDTYELLDLYKNISKDDFVKIFPQSKKYNKKDYFNVQFALARICLDEIELNNYRLFGLDLLYEILQKDEISFELEKYYNYKTKDFVKETGKYDIFSVVDVGRINISSLYFSLGEGYTEDNKLVKKFIIKNDQTFDVLFNNIDLNVDGIRFDPVEGQFKKYSNIKIYVNGKEMKFDSNSEKIGENNYWFYTRDPWFEIDYKGKIESFYVSGVCQDMDIDSVIEHISNIVEKNTIKKTIDEINSKKLINRIRNKIIKVKKS